VNEATCTPKGAGHDELCGSWRDPDYDPAEHAFYYARVLENPSCRWQAYACLEAGITCGLFGASDPDFVGCCDAAYPKTQQERAWSSPIFHRAR
jgi:hypothetical protein